MLAVKNSRTRWAVAESGENRAGRWIPPPGRVSGVWGCGLGNQCRVVGHEDLLIYE